jgi:alpha-ribazole phosphatase/probable phosphoglycerate mutase
MPEVILIRHAATDMAGTLCGQSDPPLNTLGREQSVILAQIFRNSNVRHIYATNLQRAVQTAQPMSQLLGIPINICNDLGEISFGDWEGKRWAQIRSEHPGIVALESTPGQHAPGGESYEHFRGRVLRAFEAMLKECRGEPAALITHLGPIRLILSEFLRPNDLWEPQQRIDYCSFYKIKVGSTIA